MTKIAKPSLKIKNRKIAQLINKLSVKRMKWTVCNDSSTESSSSSDDDILPMLPDTTSNELSTIEESNLENCWSTTSSSSSNYLSSLLGGSVSSLSLGEPEQDFFKKDDTADASLPSRVPEAQQEVVASERSDHHVVNIDDATCNGEGNSSLSQSDPVSVS